MIWLSVLTLPSRPAYLADTLENLDVKGGAGSVALKRFINVDGPQLSTPLDRAGWSVNSLSTAASGSRMSLYRILRDAGLAKIDRLLYFEDDVRVSKNAILAMMTVPIPRSCGFLTFCNQKRGYDGAAPGIYLRRSDDPDNAPGHWGTQAIVVPSWSLEYVANRVQLPADQYRYASDVYLGQILASRTAPTPYYGIAIPALVRHIGADTTIGEQKDIPFAGHRLGLNYAGDDIDSLALIVPWLRTVSPHAP